MKIAVFVSVWLLALVSCKKTQEGEQMVDFDAAKAKVQQAALNVIDAETALEDAKGEGQTALRLENLKEQKIAYDKVCVTYQKSISREKADEILQEYRVETQKGREAAEEKHRKWQIENGIPTEK